MESLDEIKLGSIPVRQGADTRRYDVYLVVQPIDGYKIVDGPDTFYTDLDFSPTKESPSFPTGLKNALIEESRYLSGRTKHFKR